MVIATEATGRAEAVAPGSERGFGLVFAGVFGLIGAWPLIGAHAPRWWALAIAVAFALVAFTKPDLLRGPNRLWFKFGMLLARVVNPLVMGVVFFLAVTPTGWIMRLLGKDVLALRLRREEKSYWIVREPSAPASETMKNQF